MYLANNGDTKARIDLILYLYYFWTMSQGLRCRTDSLWLVDEGSFYSLT